MLKKNETITQRCIDYTYLGLGVVKHDGFCVFVKGLIKGEKAKIAITKVMKNFAYGRIVELLETSAERVEPFCPLYPQCGGCHLQHMSVGEQLRFKEDHVQKAIQKSLKREIEVLPILAMDEPLHYRNKVQIPIETKDGRIVGGFYRYNSHDIIPMTHCGLQSDLGNRIFNRTIELLNRYEIRDIVRHILIRHAFTTGQVMVVLVVNQDTLSFQEEIVKALTSEFDAICSILLNVNTRTDNVILSDREILLYGTPYIQDELLGMRFDISCRSFYQINSIQTAKLYRTALSFAELDETLNVADVYCGIGTIGILAAKQAGSVIGIEVVAQAIEDAKKNAKQNYISNIEFICSDAKSATKELLMRQDHIDVAFIDPPRKGCDRETIDSLIELAPKRIIYVSCDPDTLARDLKIFEDQGYRVERVQPVEMFPYTYHVECVVLMSRVEK